MPDTIIPDYEVNKPKLKDLQPVNKPESWDAEKGRPNRLAGRPEKLLENVPARSQGAIYSKLVSDIDTTIKRLYEFRDGKNERLAFEATKVILDKALPNPRAEELATRHAPITVNLLSAGFIPPNTDATSPMGGTERLSQIQSVSLAPESEEDNNSDNGSNKTGDTQKGSVLASVPDVR